jgi:hypothetical protein
VDLIEDGAVVGGEGSHDVGGRSRYLAYQGGAGALVVVRRFSEVGIQGLII